MTHEGRWEGIPHQDNVVYHNSNNKIKGILTIDISYLLIKN